MQNFAIGLLIALAFGSAVLGQAIPTSANSTRDDPSEGLGTVATPRVAAPALSATRSATAAQSSSSLTVSARFTSDARRIRAGIFVYRDLDHGKEVGRATITIHHVPDSGDYNFAADSTFGEDFKGFRSQRWEAVATAGFEPISVTLASVRGTEVATVFDLTYRSGRVTGFVIDRKDSGAETTREVDAAVPANIVDQRIDWATVVAGNLKTGQQFEFNVYDPGTGIGRVGGQVGELEQIKVPAGIFHAHRIAYWIEKSGRREQYVIYASRHSPFVMLREEFPKGVISELVKVTN